MRLGKYELKAATKKGRVVLFCDHEEPDTKVRNFIFFTPNSKRPHLTINKDIADQYRLNKRAKNDLKAFRDKFITDPLLLTAYQYSINKNETNPFWFGVEMYWAGYARGVREQRQKEREKLAQRDNIGALTGNDMNDLAEALGVSENKLISACLELSAKRKGGY
ncbi:hypothetical protein [Lactococcus garvieae]|uniref:hypothetical protein n=1 Tax=Lactococcus garvieae TaxID=1363 RepID=UPI00254E86AB|nr:hypothetical protein [Lactococcus garvieae]